MNLGTAHAAGMSQREAEVLEAVGGHLSNAQIASRMHISIRTVESHVSSLLRKFGVADRRALAELAPAVAARPGPVAGTGPVPGLPAARTSFIGRDRERVAILAALSDCRVVSLVGPGGVGKTRLAAKVAEEVVSRFPFGGVFVDLVLVDEDDMGEDNITRQVATLLGVTQRPGRSLDAALHEYLGRGRSLLVLDNCEHLLSVVVAFVEKLLADCAGLTVLATSRERLAIPGERTVTVPPLSLAASRDGEPAGGDAEALFADRVRAYDPDFTAISGLVREICGRLDGVPLAIELAAARCASMGLDGLVAGLDDHLRLLAGSRGSQERHRSLRAVIDWSHNLLDADERAMFRRLGVFTDGFDLDAAVAVCGESNRGLVADLIGRLTDKSLLTYRRGQDCSRWQMLGTIRAYALDRLAASGEEAAVRDAHLSWTAVVATDLERRVEAGLSWRHAFQTVADDLRVALARASRAEKGEAEREEPDRREADRGEAARREADRREAERREVGHRLARALGHLTYAHRFMDEARAHYETAAALAAGPLQAAADLHTAADVAMAAGHGDVAFDLLLASAERAGEAGNDSAQAVALASAAIIGDRFWANFPAEVAHDHLCELADEAERVHPPADHVATAYVMAAAAWTSLPEKTIPDPELAREALKAAEQAGDPVLRSCALDAVVVGLDSNGQIREAHRWNQERFRIVKQLPGHDPHTGAEIFDAFHMATAIAVTAGDLPDALATAEAARDNDIASGQPHITASKLVLPLVLQGRFDEAFTQAAVMWEAWKAAGRPPARLLGTAAYGMILAHGLRGDDESRRVWLDRVGEFAGTGAEPVSGSNLEAAAAFTEARICLHRGHMDAAQAAIAGQLSEEQEDWYGHLHWHSLRPYAWAMAAEVAVVAALPGAARRLEAAAPAGEENVWAAACLARTRGRLHGDRAALEESLAGWDRIGARFEYACTLLLLDDGAADGRARLAALGCEPPDVPGSTARKTPM